ncbi:MULTISPECIES: heavy-metal-associated domain-containing protein [Catellatospora]|uniref:Metal-binding protein n=2 Tax=Catellatospora TaxID=53365 RepID=A0A8J3KL21_9ACTN|nr:MULTISPECIES: heavy metal-associated domain-containing protein [Catellatospora]RKE09284.1 copper chaperone CopZ [Catellatospora citrea]GIF89071.1 metal-binding protein [Catellatospora chokoriensis]GIF97239.1 metal-binding protein [Catellatospora citrea]
MSVRTTYQITGMTCGHCASAVTRELTALPGVKEVEIDLAAGNAAVVSDAVLPLDEVRNAVDEAGYQLAGVDA